MPVNEYVEDGLFEHRRVKDPELASRTRTEGNAPRPRSVWLWCGPSGWVALKLRKDGALHMGVLRKSSVEGDQLVIGRPSERGPKCFIPDLGRKKHLRLRGVPQCA